MYFDATEFAARLSTLRKAQGMTQEEMAEALNISLEHLSKMERGKRKPSIDLIIAMACYHFIRRTRYGRKEKDNNVRSGDAEDVGAWKNGFLLAGT